MLKNRIRTAQAKKQSKRECLMKETSKKKNGTPPSSTFFLDRNSSIFFHVLSRAKQTSSEPRIILFQKRSSSIFVLSLQLEETGGNSMQKSRPPWENFGTLLPLISPWILWMFWPRAAAAKHGILFLFPSEIILINTSTSGKGTIQISRCSHVAALLRSF